MHRRYDGADTSRQHWPSTSRDCKAATLSPEVIVAAKKPSGCVIGAVVAVAVAVVAIVSVVILVSRNPHAAAVLEAARAIDELERQGRVAPGADEVRKHGCEDDSTVIEVPRLAEVFADVRRKYPDAPLSPPASASIAQHDAKFVECTRLDGRPACDDIALAVAPWLRIDRTASFAVEVKAGAETRCAARYDGEGKLLGKLPLTAPWR
jgi:hypothetical protein